MKYHDVSKPIFPGMSSYPGDPQVSFETIKAEEKFNLSIIKLCSHTGSHVDSPRHVNDEGGTVDEIPLANLIGLCQVVDVSGIEEVTAQICADLMEAEPKRVLFKTLARSTMERTDNFSGLNESAADWLKDNGFILVGIDCLSIEKPEAEKPLAHKALLMAGVVVVENLDLENIRPGRYQLICLPLRLRGLDGSPARVVLAENSLEST